MFLSLFSEMYEVKKREKERIFSYEIRYKVCLCNWEIKQTNVSKCRVTKPQGTVRH